MGEWTPCSPYSWRTPTRVVMYDARGHGESIRCPADVSREAAVRDAVTVTDELGLNGPTAP